MRDMGRSDDPRVQAQLDRLGSLSIQRDTLGLDAIQELMRQLGDPHKRLPPVFHVAGTNGKGSTCAFLRAMLEAERYKVHVTTSPHLVRYNERIRLAGKLISDEELADVLAEALDAGEGLSPSFFEVTIAAAFLAFSRTPAEACVVEVGMGGRFDATNVLTPEVLAACGIAALGFDHERFLLAPGEGVPTEPMARIAFEKAGILKRKVPFAMLDYPPNVVDVIWRQAEAVGALGFDVWRVERQANGFDYVGKFGSLRNLPMPSLPGNHQIDNAGLAIAMLQVSELRPSEAAIRAGLGSATWPARLQRLSDGPLSNGREVWLDGGHNPSAGDAIARHFAGKDLHLIIGMIEGKDPAGFLAALGDIPSSVAVVPVPAHDWFPAEKFGSEARFANDVPSALAALPHDGLPVLIAGSLYLAGEVLRLNDEVPD